MAALPSGTVTFLFTDIEGSTTRWERQPEAMRIALARHDALVRAAILAHGGYVVKTMGDAFHAAFVLAHDAVAAALEAQRRLQAELWSDVGPIRVRMAVHTGAAEALRELIGRPLTRAQRAAHDRDLATVQYHLDPTEFAAVWAEGRTMTWEQAITHALELPGSR